MRISRRGDGVVPELLGMKRIVSKDAVRRAFAAIEEEAGAAWLRLHLDYCTVPLLAKPWIRDMDTTVKPLYAIKKGRSWVTILRSLGPTEPLLSHLFGGRPGPRTRCLYAGCPDARRSGGSCGNSALD